MDGSRTRFLKTRNCMDQCSFRSSLAVIRQRYQLPVEAKNTTPCTHHLETLQILPDVGTGTALFLLPSFPSQRVHRISLFYSSRVDYFQASKRQRKRTEFQMFCRQLYHMCLDLIFAPLKEYSTKPKIMKCPDGHFHHVIFGLGPYIADYPEQVWLSGVVSNWCPK